MGHLTHCRNPAFKNLFIRAITQMYHVNLEEALEPDINSYGCFNEFFTRPLKPEARPITRKPGALASPADGFLSQAGTID